VPCPTVAITEPAGSTLENHGSSAPVAVSRPVAP